MVHNLHAGAADFVDAYTKEAFNVSNLHPVVTSDPSVVAEAETFTVIDFDADGVPEAVLQLGPNESNGFEILHVKNDGIYGYWTPYRAFRDLKEDGTFTFSSGAGNTGIGKLTFEDQTYEMEELAHSEVLYAAGNNPVSSFFVNGQEATREAFDSEMEKQAQKSGALGEDFTVSNVSAYFE